MSYHQAYESYRALPDDAYKQNIALPRKLRSGPVTAPSIDVVLVAGDQLPAVKDVCVRFAQDFDMHYLQIFDYLTELLDPRKHDRAAYGFLHPDSLSVLLDQSPAFAQTELFAFFLIPILRYKIDCEVARGRRKFLVLGLGEYINAALAFQSEIAEPAAIVAFEAQSGSDLQKSSMNEKVLPCIVLGVQCGDSEDVIYERLTNQVAAFALSSSLR